MTRPLPFTEASIRRAVSAARKAGLRVVGIQPDGTLMVQDGENPANPLSDSPVPLQASQTSKWEDAEA